MPTSLSPAALRAAADRCIEYHDRGYLIRHWGVRYLDHSHEDVRALLRSEDAERHEKNGTGFG